MAVSCACATAGHAPEATTLAASAEVRRRLDATSRFLADDQLEGRGTPGRGLDLAALYLVAELRAAGWLPVGNGSYLQTYEALEYSPAQARTRVVLNGQELGPTEYLFVNRGIDPAATPRRHDLLFAGPGAVWQERAVDQLAGADLRGKAVVALKGSPWPFDPNAIVFQPDHVVGKGIQAMARNAALLVYVTDEFGKPENSGEVRGLLARSRMPVSMLATDAGRAVPPWAPIVAIPPSVFDRALARAAGGTFAEWQDRLARGSIAPRPLEARIEVEIDAQPKRARASNVVAVLPGTDPALRDEWLVMMAHYDHLGMREAEPGKDRVYHGADDNASGVAVVLEAARRLAAGPKPRRSVLCLLTSGEERFLLGSTWYTLHPVAPMDRVTAYVNVDMVGRSSGGVSAIATLSPAMATAVADAGGRKGIRVDPEARPELRSIYLIDGYPFARLDVPGVDLFTDFHADYHQVTDTADKIRLDELVRVTAVVADVVEAFAQGAPKAEVRRPSWFLTPD
jgi:hypothetical protein